MADTKELALKGKFDWRVPSVLTSFVQGDEARAIYDSIKDSGLGNLGYDEKTKTMWGSNSFVAARIDTEARKLGLRVATLRDLNRPEVMQMIEGKHYSDTPAFVARSANDSSSQNQKLLEQILSLVEAKQNKIKFPFMITGFDCQTPYVIIPRSDFSVVEDERFDGKYNQSKFNEVDELGLPKFDKSGKRTWYARNQGLSGLCLCSDLDLSSGDGGLSSSGGVGRVVLLSGEASAQNFEAQLRAQYNEAQKALDTRYQNALNVLKGNQ